MKIGDRIIFKHEIIEEETEDTPAFLLAKKGEKGNILKVDGERYYVQPDNHNPFYADKSEFELIGH